MASKRYRSISDSVVINNFDNGFSLEFSYFIVCDGGRIGLEYDYITERRLFCSDEIVDLTVTIEDYLNLPVYEVFERNNRAKENGN